MAVYGGVGVMNEFPDFKTRGFDVDAYNKRFHEANVIIDAEAKSVSYPEHWGGLSVKCAFGGSEYYQASNALYRVDDGVYLIFNEGKLYSSWIDAKQPVQSYTLNMSPRFERLATKALLQSHDAMLDDPDGKGEPRIRFVEQLHRHAPNTSLVMNSIRQLGMDLQKNHVRVEELFFELFSLMVSADKQTRLSPHGGMLRGSSQLELFQRLIRARDFIHSCHELDLTLGAMAEIACLNPFYFLRTFKTTFGLTPHQFLMHERIASASNLLLHSDAAVSDICLKVGFQDHTSFSKLFKRLKGDSPTDFRVQMRSRKSIFA